MARNRVLTYYRLLAVSTLLGPTDPNLGVRKVDGSSPLGIYVRQCRLDFNTMPFDRAAALFVAVETYRNDTGSVDHVEERMENLSVGIPLPGTPRRTLFSPAQTGDKSPAPSHSNRDLLGTTAEQDLHMWIQRQMASIESEIRVSWFRVFFEQFHVTFRFSRHVGTFTSFF